MRITRIAVIGAGTMGCGIAQAAAGSGFTVLLADRDHARAQAGADLIRQRLEQRSREGKVTVEDREALLSRIAVCSGVEECAHVELVIEAATESAEVKEEIFRRLDPVCPAGTIFASNTSAICISGLAAASGRPERFIGMHFMNPATVMRLVEVVPGLLTSRRTVDAVTAVAREMGKEAIVVRDSPGFVANRVLMPLVNEAIRCLQEEVASAEGIDAILRLGANLPMGPLELADFIGLDVCLRILETLHGELGDRFLPCPLLRRMVAAGKLGRKSGEGFYGYR